MNESIKKLTDETKAILVTALATKAVEDLISSTKSASDSDSGSFKVVASTSDIDRQGESVDQKGWDLTHYKSNPVVLWAHDYTLLPIGVCTSIEVRDGKLVAEGKFAPAEANPFAQQIRKLYDLGMVNTTSVGFIAKEYDAEKSGVIAKSELLEFSFVPVPANPHALRLSMIKELGIDTAMLKTKGIEIKEETDPAPAATPAPEVTPETTPEAAKGAISEQLDAMKKQKYAMYRPVWDLMDAMCSVYFAEGTPPEDLGKILSEGADILKQISTTMEVGTSPEGEKAISESITKLLGTHQPIAIKESILAIIRNHVAFGNLELSTGDKSSKETKPAKERSKNPEALNDVNSFVDTRELLRTIVNTGSKALENFNIAARSHQR